MKICVTVLASVLFLTSAHTSFAQDTNKNKKLEKIEAKLEKSQEPWLNDLELKKALQKSKNSKTVVHLVPEYHSNILFIELKSLCEANAIVGNSIHLVEMHPYERKECARGLTGLEGRKSFQSAYAYFLNYFLSQMKKDKLYSLPDDELGVFLFGFLGSIREKPNWEKQIRSLLNKNEKLNKSPVGASLQRLLSREKLQVRQGLINGLPFIQRPKEIIDLGNLMIKDIDNALVVIRAVLNPIVEKISKQQGKDFDFESEELKSIITIRNRNLMGVKSILRAYALASSLGEDTITVVIGGLHVPEIATLLEKARKEFGIPLKIKIDNHLEDKLKRLPRDSLSVLLELSEKMAVLEQEREQIPMMDIVLDIYSKAKKSLERSLAKTEKEIDQKLITRIAGDEDEGVKFQLKLLRQELKKCPSADSINVSVRQVLAPISEILEMNGVLKNGSTFDKDTEEKIVVETNLGQRCMFLSTLLRAGQNINSVYDAIESDRKLSEADVKLQVDDIHMATRFLKQNFEMRSRSAK